MVFSENDFALVLVINVVMAVTFCVCCIGEGLVTIGILTIVASFLMLEKGSEYIPLSFGSFVAGMFWIAFGKNKINKQRALLAAAREVDRRAARSPAAVNISVVQHAEGSRRDQVHLAPRTRRYMPVATAEARLFEDDQTKVSNVTYSRTVPPVEMPVITFGGGLDMAASSSNLQSFEILDGNREDNLERGMEKFEKFQDTRKIGRGWHTVMSDDHDHERKNKIFDASFPEVS